MQELSSDTVCIIEKDTNSDVLLTWTYPSIEEDMESILISRSNLSYETIPLQFTFSKYKNSWVYIFSHVNEHTDSTPLALKRVAVFSICLLKNSFYPEKFAALCKLMALVYAKSGDPTILLQCHLSLLTRGMFDGGPLGKFVDSEYDPRRAFLVTSLKDIIRMFGEDSVLLWVAFLTKKRVVVYADKLGVLLKLIRGLPLLVWHRQNWNILRPFVTMSSQELTDLTSAGVYCAGFIDPAVKSQQSLYDIFVDVNARSITVPTHAKDDFALGAYHQDLANYLVSMCDDNEINDQALIKGLALKTKDLLTKLDGLRVEDPDDHQRYITMEGLQQVRLPPNMAPFLYAVASAEGLTQANQAKEG